MNWLLPQQDHRNLHEHLSFALLLPDVKSLKAQAQHLDLLGVQILEKSNEKANIKLHHSAYKTFRLMLFPNSGCKINMNPHFIFSSLKMSDKIQASKIVFGNMTAGKMGPVFMINTYCVRTAGWWGSRDKGMSDSPTGCSLPEQPLWNHGNTGGLHLKTKVTNASAWTLHS